MSGSLNTNRGNGNGGGDDYDECACIILRFFAILVMVVMPLELLLLSQGYTFTPYFFFVLVLSLCRSSKRNLTTNHDNNNNNNSRSSRNHNNNNNNPTGLNRYPLPDSVHRHLPLPQDDNNDVFQDEEAPSSRNDDGDPSMNNKNSKTARIVFPSGISFQRSKSSSNSKSKCLPSGFVQMVKVSNKKDPIDGLREIRYETAMSQNGRGDDIQEEESSSNALEEIVPAKSLVDLKFKRGFQGWNITGTGHRIKESEEEEDDGEATSSTKDAFVIHRGFLSKSGKLYWDERGEHYGVLVVAVVSDTSLADDSFVHGEWASSRAFRVEDENQRKAHRGTIVGFRFAAANKPGAASTATSEDDGHSIV